MAQWTCSPFRYERYALLGMLLAVLLQACASLPRPPPPDNREASCERFFGRMDSLVAKYGVNDAGTSPISGYPELRVDRFLASFAGPDLAGDAYAAWVERLRKLGENDRLIEFRNLPSRAAAQIQAPFGQGVANAVGICGRVLADRDLKTPARRAYLLRHAEVPDAYSTWMRVLGLYPLTRWAAAEGVWRLHRELRQPFLATSGNPAATGTSVRYAPPTSDIPDAGEIARILSQSADNSLQVPEPSKDSLERLFAAFAPIWAVETDSDSDRIGVARMKADGKAYIDTTAPVVYRLATHARMGRQVLLQLVYLVWFPARPPQGILDIYAGQFDGLIWRVTLGKDGKPLAYDSIHPCGCYYQAFPGEGFRIAQAKDSAEPILSPMPIPRLGKGERLVIRIASRTHFIEGITTEKREVPATVYGWQDYDELRSLPLPDGSHHSLFGSDGLLSASERPERFLLWPLGVPSAGAMRQWGTHAIAFIGRRHFDDPRLLETFLRPLER